jgi:hypothetical protein
MTAEDRYATPAAFRSALTDRIKATAASGPWTIQQLQRQVSYDRILERLYLIDNGWIVKGATALLARDLGVRASLDVDVYRDVTRQIAEADLRRAAALDLGDWFRFDVGTGSPIATASVRLAVTALIGTTVWVRFHVDLVGADLQMTGQPDDVPPLARGVIPDVEQHGYRVYPLVDHIADKIAAIYERHGDAGGPSTRYRDLVDLVAIVGSCAVRADAQIIALRSEFERRRLTWPVRFEAPDRATWRTGYAAEAQRSLLTAERSLDDALAAVAPFVDPLFDGSVHGQWSPGERIWTDLHPR